MIRACLRSLPRLLPSSLPRRHLHCPPESATLDMPYTLHSLAEQPRPSTLVEKEQHSSSEFESDSDDSSDFYSQTSSEESSLSEGSSSSSSSGSDSELLNKANKKDRAYLSFSSEDQDEDEQPLRQKLHPGQQSKPKK